MSATHRASARLALLTSAALLAGVSPSVGAGKPAANWDWTRFGYDAARTSAPPGDVGISAADAPRLARRQITLGGTVDSSPIELRNVLVGRRSRDVVVVTTTYGKTIALDPARGTVLWRYVPPGIAHWEGSAQITTATPLADPDRTHLYAASPDGSIHKLALRSGREVRSGGWPVTVTRDPTHEKLASPLNLSAGRVIVATGGYIGDAPPYQGHLVTIDRRRGRIVGVVNSLCADRHELIVPSSCPSSDSAIWGRNAPVVEPDGHMLVATGNGPWNGHTDFGDSVLEISPDGRRITGVWTPANQADLNATDTDLGSTAPALLRVGRVRYAVQGGKDGRLHLLALSRLNRRVAAVPAGGPAEVGSVATPGGEPMFTAPAVGHVGRRPLIFVATGGGTAAYALRGSRLSAVWQNSTAGTSPVLADGLLYVYDPAGALDIYLAASGRRVARLPAAPGHWNSPIVIGGRVILPEGNANEHARSGGLSIYSMPAN